MQWLAERAGDAPSAGGVRVGGCSSFSPLADRPVWPAASSVDAIGATAQACWSLEADFNNDGFADLAVGAQPRPSGVSKGWGGQRLYWSAGGLTGVAVSCFPKAPAGWRGGPRLATSFGFSLASGISTTTASLTWPWGIR